MGEEGTKKRAAKKKEEIRKGKRSMKDEGRNKGKRKQYWRKSE